MQQLVASTGSTGGRARPVATSRATFTRSHAASRNVLEMGEVGSTSTRMLSMHQSQPCALPEQGRHPGTDSARGREKYPSWSVLMIRGIASRNHRHAPPDQRRALRCFRDPTSSPLRQHPSTDIMFFFLAASCLIRSHSQTTEQLFGSHLEPPRPHNLRNICC